MTYDQGREMDKQNYLQVLLGLRCISSTQEAHGNEVLKNTNGLVRFFPKGTDFNKVNSEVKKVQDLLNGRPRATLNFQKSYEIFNQLINSNTVALNVGD